MAIRNSIARAAEKTEKSEAMTFWTDSNGCKKKVEFFCIHTIRFHFSDLLLKVYQENLENRRRRDVGVERFGNFHPSSKGGNAIHTCFGTLEDALWQLEAGKVL